MASIRELLYKLADILGGRVVWDGAVASGIGYLVNRQTGDLDLAVLCGGLAFLITVRFPER